MATAGAASKGPQPGFFGRHNNVYLYVPNLIGATGATRAGWVPRPGELTTLLNCCAGYARVVFALYAFAIALVSPEQCFLAYFLRWVLAFPASIARQDCPVTAVPFQTPAPRPLLPARTPAYQPTQYPVNTFPWCAVLSAMSLTAALHGSLTRPQRWGRCWTWSPTGVQTPASCVYASISGNNIMKNS
jgi:hypothetical protein